MKLDNTLNNEAILSNVGQIGEFRIKNSAKAFGILSSGLYANKVRAIIRELSCNAYDSHVAAGKTETPFDVHLPNILEPWFSIRDYGVGLSHTDVINIYTTYFESTKTESNAFVGALGLGSKSPFSYTDNFTVTSVKDGRLGIYTAFINDQGVPSIALMNEHETTDPNGVEVRFAVESHADFYKFSSEATYVYRFFTHKPVVSGNDKYVHSTVSFTMKNIIPGVHEIDMNDMTYNTSKCIAVMGNIAYPIEVPKAEMLTKEHADILYSNRLLFEFDIGELEFQASREGLSYVPKTLDAIKSKLNLVVQAIDQRVEEDANKIKNVWERLRFLTKLGSGRGLWLAGIKRYASKNDLGFKINEYALQFEKKMFFQDISTKFNIDSSGCFAVSASNNTRKSRPALKLKAPMLNETSHAYEPGVLLTTKNIMFVVNDLKTGALTRAKYHYSNTTGPNVQVIVLTTADRTQGRMDLTGFFDYIQNPPEENKVLASTLTQRERAVATKIPILSLVHINTARGRRHYSYNDKLVWRPVSDICQFDDKVKYYYLPLVNSTEQSRMPAATLKSLLSTAKIYEGEIYGVRRSSIEDIKKKKNWINLEDMIKEKLASYTLGNKLGIIKRAIAYSDTYKWKFTSTFISALKDSPYISLYNELHDASSSEEGSQVFDVIDKLCTTYDVDKTGINNDQIEVKRLISEYTEKLRDIQNRYPLLQYIDHYRTVDLDAILFYIKMIDSAAVKGEDYHPKQLKSIEQ